MLFVVLWFESKELSASSGADVLGLRVDDGSIPEASAASSFSQGAWGIVFGALSPNAPVKASSTMRPSRLRVGNGEPSGSCMSIRRLLRAYNDRIRFATGIVTGFCSSDSKASSKSAAEISGSVPSALLVWFSAKTGLFSAFADASAVGMERFGCDSDCSLHCDQYRATNNEVATPEHTPAIAIAVEILSAASLAKPTSIRHK